MRIEIQGIVQIVLALTGCGLAIVGSPYAGIPLVTLVRYTRSINWK